MNKTEQRARLAQIDTRLDDIDAQMIAIHDAAKDRSLTATEQTRWDGLKVDRDTLGAERNEVDTALRNAIKLDVVNGAGRKADVPNFQHQRTNTESDRGRRTIDNAHREGTLPSNAAEKATALIDEGHPGARGLADRWATAAGDPAYRGAFAKMLGDPDRGHLTWNAAEAESYRQVAKVQAEMMSTTGANGGFMIPLTLDPAIMLTNSGSNNPLRQLATVKQTMTNAWQGVTSAGATSEWKAENAEAADGSPTLGDPSIPVHLGDSFVPYSFEVGMDAENFLSELAIVLMDSADNLMADAYTTGTGSGQPQGIVTGLAGTASEINGQGSEALAATDPFDLQNALGARFSANATFQGHIATMNAYRRFETPNGAHEFPELRENPPSLLGKPFFENSNMDSAIDPAATANNYMAIYGDIARAFYIVDRVGATMEMIPNMIGANQRPTGERGALLWFRTGSKVVNVPAARLLDIPTTA